MIPDGCGALPLSGQLGKNVPGPLHTRHGLRRAALSIRRGRFALPAGRKASPGGEAGATSVATDEVEATDYRHKLVRRCYLRPHPVRRCRTTFPSRGRLWPVQTGSPYRPSSVSADAEPPSPRGRLPSEGRRTSTLSNRTPPHSPSVTEQ